MPKTKAARRKTSSARQQTSARTGAAPKIRPFLWFDHQAEEAAKFYVSVFPKSKILSVARYPEGSPAPAGTVMTVDFELQGQRFTALNAGPVFKFTEAISFVVDCKTQEEVDRYWSKLTQDGGSESQCGWLKDRYGLSWQIVPTIMSRLFTDPDRAAAKRAMQAMLKMKKLDIAELKRAFEG